MNQGFGIESARAQSTTALRQAARFLVLIDAGGYAVARLFSDKRIELIEFDAATEETSSMLADLTVSTDASGAEWDRALAGHSAAERAAARVYELST